MKKVIVVMIVLVCASVCFANEPNMPLDFDGFAISAMSQTNANSAFNLRLSYRMGMLEPILGAEFRLDSDPETFDIGCLIHSRDIIEAESIPWLSDTLIDIFNEDLVLTGYTGFHSTINVGVNKGSYYGSLFGVEAKDKPDSQLSIVAEQP